MPVRPHQLLSLAFLLSSCSGSPTVEVVPLPDLIIGGEAARAHTQGLWVDGDTIWVTARRDDVSPRRALLLRTRLGAARWDVWDITPDNSGRDPRDLPDHPGGMDCDGTRLWIPIAPSRPGGTTHIHAYELSTLRPGKRAEPVRRVLVDDHIGALAVIGQGDLYGASWDTRDVYVWSRDGEFREKVSAEVLDALGLGVRDGPDAAAGLAVQDWKGNGARLTASGIWKGDPSVARGERSRLMILDTAVLQSPSPDRAVLERGGTSPRALVRLPLLAQGESARG